MRYLVRFSLAGLAALTACGRATPAPAPQLSALLAAGDSTFWISTSGREVVLRRSPMLVTRVEGRVVELYVTDEDLTHEGALLVSQRVFRRDLVTGDSVLVRYDTSIAAIASRWLVRHPGARRLAPDEDPAEEPATQATTDVRLLDAVGPWLSVETRIDVDAEGEPHQHVVRRGVIDLRTGLPVQLRDLVAPGEARRVDSIGRLQLAAAIDSIRSRRDARAARARAMAPSLVFDATSFEVTGGPAFAVVAFLVPGRGEHAGGYALPMDEIPVNSPALDAESAPDRPASVDSRRIEWISDGWTIVATAEADGTGASIEVTRGGQRWPLGTVPLPVRRLMVLADTALNHALRTAFDDAESGATARPARISFPYPWRHRGAPLLHPPLCKPRPPETPKRSLPT